MNKEDERYIPPNIRDKNKWFWSRRQFFRQLALAGLATQVGFIGSCLPENDSFSPLSKKQYRTLQLIQNILFPADEWGPSAAEFNADRYIIWMLNDPRMDPEENEYLVNGLNWTNEESETKFNQTFSRLDRSQQEDLVQHLFTTDWGENWLSVNLTYIFEAMISDPVYGFNEGEIGWQWLEHVPGIPRPDVRTMYDEVFESVKSNGQ